MNDLTRIKKQLAAASPGPWEWAEFNIEDPDQYDCYLMRVDGDGIQWSIYEGGAPVCANELENRANLQLIAAAPTVIAALVAEIERLRAELAERADT